MEHSLPEEACPASPWSPPSSFGLLPNTPMTSQKKPTSVLVRENTAAMSCRHHVPRPSLYKNNSGHFSLLLHTFRYLSRKCIHYFTRAFKTMQVLNTTYGLNAKINVSITEANGLFLLLEVIFTFLCVPFYALNSSFFRLAFLAFLFPNASQCCETFSAIFAHCLRGIVIKTWYLFNTYTYIMKT